MVKRNTSAGSRKRRDVLTLVGLALIIVLLNYLASFYFRRFDLTSEKRYTLSASTRQLLAGLGDEVYLKIYLDAGINPGFTRLRNETREILDEFAAYSKGQVRYEFLVPGEGMTREEATAVERQLYMKGLVPEEISVRGKDRVVQSLVWPGALVSYKGREGVWQIFTRQTPGISLDESINNSVEDLEYSLTNAIRKLQRTKKREVTFLHGHGETDTVRTYDFMRSLSEYYNVNVTTITPGRELSALKGTDALVIVKPDSAFTDKEKFVVDQFIMRGGKVLWLIDPVNTNLDSLRKGFTIGVANQLGIEEMLFKYGVRLNPVLVQDLQCGYLKINTGFQKGQPRFELLPWVYSVLALPDNDHPVVKNLDLVKFDYVSTLDTIVSAHGIKKTILLKTSRYTRTQPTPARIYLGTARQRHRESQFINSYQPIACLLEGRFTSFVENRLPHALLSDTAFHYLDHGVETKMIVVADGDVAANDYQRTTGQVFPLGFDRNTQQTFANRIFLLNCVNYLLDDEGLLSLRSREVKLRLLDKKKISTQRTAWQIVNVGVPVIIIIAAGLLGFYLRKRRYTAR